MVVSLSVSDVEEERVGGEIDLVLRLGHGVGNVFSSCYPGGNGRYRLVTDLLQICYRFVTDLLQTCYKLVTDLLQTCYRLVTDLLQTCYRLVTDLLQKKQFQLTSKTDIYLLSFKNPGFPSIASPNMKAALASPSAWTIFC